MHHGDNLTGEKPLDSIFRINEPGRIQPTCEYVGRSRLPLLILDNFFADPGMIRNFARAIQFERRNIFTGGVSFGTSANPLPMIEAIKAFLPHSIEVDDTQAPDLIWYTDQPSETANPHLFVPHVDQSLSGVLLVYLNLPDQCAGGTGFYRHKHFGIDYIPASPNPSIKKLMEENGLSDFEEFYRFLRRTKRLSLSDALLFAFGAPTEKSCAVASENWEQIHFVPMRYNRLIFYDPKIFHMPEFGGKTFGESCEEGRLLLRIPLASRGATVDPLYWARS